MSRGRVQAGRGFWAKENKVCFTKTKKNGDEVVVCFTPNGSGGRKKGSGASSRAAPKLVLRKGKGGAWTSSRADGKNPSSHQFQSFLSRKGGKWTKSVTKTPVTKRKRRILLLLPRTENHLRYLRSELLQRLVNQLLSVQEEDLQLLPQVW